MNERTCLNCRHWFPDFEAELPSGPRRFIKGTYGKCRATYLDKSGRFQSYNEGTFGSMPCTATNDYGEHLFEAGPQD